MGPSLAGRFGFPSSGFHRLLVPATMLGRPLPLSLLTPFNLICPIHKFARRLRVEHRTYGVCGGVPLVCLARSGLGPSWGPLTRVDHQVEWRGRKGGCWRHAREQLEVSGAGQGVCGDEGEKDDAGNKCTPVTLMERRVGLYRMYSVFCRLQDASQSIRVLYSYIGACCVSPFAK